MITRTITVTQEDIQNGMPACNDACPIALAMQRVFGKEAHVGTMHFWPTAVEWPDAPVEGDLPRSARKFVRDYDDGRPVKPFRFKASYQEDPHANQG